MKNINRYFLIAQIFVFILGFNQAYGESRNTTPQMKQILKVGVLSTPPYSYFVQGKPTGLSFDIWINIAMENGWRCRYINAGENINAAISKVHSGELDVLLGQIVQFSKTEKAGYLSLGYLHSHFVLVGKKVLINFRTRLHNVFKIIPLNMYFIVILIYIMYMILFYVFEYKKQPKLVKLGRRQAFEHILWLSLLSGLRKAPLFPYTRFIRLISVMWRFLFSAIILSLFAGVTSTFIAGWMSSGEKLVHLSDLNNKFVDVFGGNAEEGITDDMGLNIDTMQSNITNAVEHLDQGTIAAIVMPNVAAESYFRNHARDDLYISHIKLKSYNLSFLFSEQKKTSFTRF